MHTVKLNALPMHSNWMYEPDFEQGTVEAVSAAAASV